MANTAYSITIPISYWYLQHFDLLKIELAVDWFNTMFYDLYELWDKDNKWLGPYLNSNANLTEITEHPHLFWRNSIELAKVNKGLVFHSPTSIASDPSCISPGCTIDGVGDPKPCINGLGTLSCIDLAGSTYSLLRFSQEAAFRAASLSCSSQALILAASDLAAYEACCSGVS